MSQHKNNRDKDSRTAKKNSNGAVLKQTSVESNKNIEIKYTKVLEDGGGKKKTSTTHQETMTDPTIDVLAASR